CYLLLSDSNNDWGQGLPELARWQHQHEGTPLDVWYFGSDPRVYRLPMHVMPLHLLPIRGPEDVRAQVQGHYLAVSTTLLYGTPTNLPGHRGAAAFLRSRTPVARTATFLIYDFTGDEGRSGPAKAATSASPTAPGVAGRMAAAEGLPS